MQTKNYYKLIAKLSLLGILISAVLSLILYGRGPHVRLVRFDSKIEESFATNGSTVTLHFDRPILQQDYTQSLSFEPGVEFSAITNEQRIVVTFKEALRANTTYTLKLEPNISDNTDRPMKESYIHTFKTGSPRFIYLQRNYGPDQNIFNDKDDKVIVGSVVGAADSEEVYSAPVIRNFAANSKHAVVVVTDGEDDKLVIIDLKTKKAREPKSNLKGYISNISLSQQGDTAVFTNQIDYSSVSPEYYEEYNNRVYALDIKTDNVRPLTKEGDDPIKAYNLTMNNDGQFALISDELGSYYLVSPFNDYEPILLGGHDFDYGFGSNDAEVIFNDRGRITSYELATSTVSERNLGSLESLQGINYRGNKIFFAYTASEYDAKATKFATTTEIYSSTGWGAETQKAWREPENNNGSVRSFAPSHGADYLALQYIPDGCEYDQLGATSQCKFVQTIIQKIGSEEASTVINGFDLVWLP